MADTDSTKKKTPAGGRRENTKKASSKTGSGKSSSGTAKKKESSTKTSGSSSRLRDEVTAILLLAAGVFLMVSVLTSATGKFGEVLSHVLKGLFGIGAYILPFYIILYAILILRRRMARVSFRSIFFFVLMYLDLVTLNAVRFDAVKASRFSAEYLRDMYISGTSLDSAGAVGMAIGWPAVRAVGIAGLVIICTAILAVSLLLLINTPISAFLDRRREKKRLHALEKEAAYKEAQARERKIEEQKAKNGKKKEENENDAGTVGLLSSSPGADLPDDSSAENRATTPEKKGGSPMGDAFDRLKIKSMGLFRSGSREGDKQEEDPFLTENKRQILKYMNDDNLFDGDFSGDEKFRDGYIFGLKEEDSVLPARPQDDFERFSIFSGAEDLSFRTEEGMAPESAPGAYGDSEADDLADLTGSCTGGKDPEESADTAENLSCTAHSDQKLSKAEMKAAVAAGAAEVAEEAEKTTVKKEYHLPPLTLLNAVRKQENRNLRMELAAKAHKLETVLHDFGVSARVIDVKQGPSVTRYEIQPDSGVKVNSIVRLANDIALNLEAKSLRIEAPIPGKAAVGIEVENEKASVVTLREMIESTEFQKAESKISFVVGEDIAGNSVVADLKSMPHLLIAGSTGSGKSVCINSIIMSILYKSTPDEVKLILIDPKVVELGNYNGIPHMLIPVVTDPSKAAAALAWAVQEMNDRYRKFAENSVRDLKSYNAKMETGGQTENMLPQIVIIIDELADLMMAAPSQVEESICRLAQLARAAGMHLIVATQRPSVDIVTGLIKANIPSRIAFAVSSQVDSRTILDRAGAEKLVGKGDMLFNPIGKAQPERLQGPFVTDDEVNAVIGFWKEQAEESDAPNRIMESINTAKVDIGDDEEEDELLNDAIELVVNAEQASASMLQRRFRIGYNRAGRLVDIMEARGIIGPSEGSRPRRVLITKEEFYGAPPEDEVPESEQPLYDQSTGEQDI